jgi:hypothetical protein
MQLSSPSRLPPSWTASLPAEMRQLLEFMARHEVLAAALSSPGVLDVRPRAAEGDAAPLIPHATAIDIDPASPEALADILTGVPSGRQCIVLRDVVQRLPDYRGFIKGWFEKLAVGGRLVVIVPHQFLLERKWQVPSRIDPGHLRFYTPGALLAEIEEAIDPCESRVRVLADNDIGHDYAAGIEGVPAGGRDIVLCVERIARPAWCDDLGADETPVATAPGPTRYPPLEPSAPPRYRVIVPDPHEITRVFVLKLDHRGDFLMARQAFRVLRAAFPEAAITLACGSWNRAEAEASGLFDRVLAFDFFPEDVSAGLATFDFDERSRAFAAFVGDAPYDVAIDLRLYGDTRDLLKHVNARHRSGFDPYDAHPWLTVRLNLPIPTHDGRAEHIFMPASAFETTLGRPTWTEIMFPRRRYAEHEHLVWGPYLPLKQGRYVVELLVESPRRTFKLPYDMVAERATRVVGRGVVEVTPGRHPRIGLFLLEPIKGFECRLFAPQSGRLPDFRFGGLACTRPGSYAGAHQSEAMALLAHLTALRLRNAFTVTEP